MYRCQARFNVLNLRYTPDTLRIERKTELAWKTSDELCEQQGRACYLSASASYMICVVHARCAGFQAHDGGNKRDAVDCRTRVIFTLHVDVFVALWLREAPASIMLCGSTSSTCTSRLPGRRPRMVDGDIDPYKSRWWWVGHPMQTSAGRLKSQF
jgi:hypothetical protein